jgi:glycosyltransferase involved in cell wall biosynthesis
VTYEAAAAGLPILAPPLNGIRDLIRDGENGFLVTRSKPSITSALERITTLSEKQRQEMGENARRSAASFSEERFVDAWRSLYGNLKGPLVQQQQVERMLLTPRRLARISPFRFLSHF